MRGQGSDMAFIMQLKQYHLNSFSDDHTNCIYAMVNFHKNNWLQGNMFLPLCAKPATLKMMRDKPYLLEKAIRQCLTRGGGSNGKLIIFMCKKSPFSSWSFECCWCGAYRLVQKKVSLFEIPALLLSLIWRPSNLSRVCFFEAGRCILHLLLLY